MKRRAEAYLIEWYQRPNRKPLVIRGARQVGKSTLVRLAAATLKVPLWEVNLERHRGLDSAFATNSPATICTEIGIATGMAAIGETAGILFLDEIQAVPHALAALRYFLEERPDIAVVAAGSLLEFLLSEYPYPMPVGRIEYLHLGPVSFDEYCAAAAPGPIVDAYRSWIPGQPFSELLHERLTDLFRQFLQCGGMPEAAAAYAQHQDAIAVRTTHLSILETYLDDFGSYARSADLHRLRTLFSALPAAVGSKLKYAAVNPLDKARETRRALDLLSHAGIVSLVHHSDGVGLPLGAQASDSVFKPLFLDVGLMQTALGLPPIPHGVQFSRFVNDGARAEQFAGQELLHRAIGPVRPELHYWVREGRSTNAEVDYLLQSGGCIIPVEVKAGAAGAMRSLHQFMACRTSPLAIRLDMNPPTMQQVKTDVSTVDGMRPVSYRLLSLPLYFAGRVDAIAAAAQLLLP